MLEVKDATIALEGRILATGLSFMARDGQITCVTGAFRRMMAYLPQQIQSLRHQLMPVEAPVCEAEEYGVWNALLPGAIEAVEPAPLSPEEIFQLAEQTLQETFGKQIIIADEPAALLTPELALRLLQLLRNLADNGKTVLIASRRPLLVEHADLVIEMNQNS